MIDWILIQTFFQLVSEKKYTHRLKNCIHVLILLNHLLRFSYSARENIILSSIIVIKRIRVHFVNRFVFDLFLFMIFLFFTRSNGEYECQDCDELCNLARIYNKNSNVASGISRSMVGLYGKLSQWGWWRSLEIFKNSYVKKHLSNSSFGQRSIEKEENKEKEKKIEKKLKGDSSYSCNYCNGHNHIANNCMLRTKEEK